jgi:hypothetical protein
MTALPQAFLETRLWQDDDLSGWTSSLAPTIFRSSSTARPTSE